MHQPSLLPSTWDIPDSLRARIGEGPGRQRMMEAEGHLLLVLHAPPELNEEQRRGRFLWRKPDGSWQGAGGPSGPTALGALLDEYGTMIERLDRLEAVADTSRNYFDLMNHLSPVVRSSRNLYQVLQDARQAAREDRRLIISRDRAYELSRQAELLYTDAKNGLDYAIARQNEAQAKSGRQMAVAAHRLNLMAAFFFPVATLTAIFGVNLRHGLEGWDDSSGPLPLLAVLASGLLLGVLLTGFVVRRHTSQPEATDAGRTGSTGAR